MSDDSEDFSKFQRDPADDIRPIDMPPPAPSGGAAVADDAGALGELPAAELKKRKLKRLADGSLVPEDIGDYVYDENLNRMYKGDYVDLLRKVPSLRQLYIAVGWDNKSMEEDAVDVDLSCFLLNKDGQTRVDEDFLFYNNAAGSDGAVKHLGDNRTGVGEGDNESISIDLSGVTFDIQKIMISLTIYDEAMVGFHLGQVRNLFVRLINLEDNLEIARYTIEDDLLEGYNALLPLCLVREGPRWYAEILETLTKGGLQDIAKGYGLIIQEDTG